MDNKIDTLCEHTKLRLIAAALGHQQCTKSDGTEVLIPGTNKRILIGSDAYLAKVALPAALTPLDFRAQGREEALQIILGQDPECPFDDYTGNSPNGDSGDYSGYWMEEELRKLLHIDDCKHDAFGRAEAMYWEARMAKEEAEQAKRLVERAPYFKRLHDFLAAQQSQEAWDLLADLQREAESAPKTTLPEDVAALFGACGFEIRSTNPAEKHPLAVCGSLDAAGLVVEKLLTELLPDATSDQLDMLGRIDPATAPEQQAQWFERLCAARAAELPAPGAVIIWRADLVWAVAELLQLRAYREHHRAKQAMPSERCPHCDDTGDVHSPTGEWRGTCTCPAGATLQPGATDSEGGHHD